MLAIMTRLRLLVAFIGVAALAALLTLAAFSSEADASHSWGNYHWANNKDSDSNGTPDEFVLNLGDNVSSEWDSYLRAASGPAEPYPVDPAPAFNSNDWSDSSVLDTTVVPSTKNPAYCRPTSGMVEVCNYTYDKNWLGLAQIWLRDNHITQGTTKLNDTYFYRDRYNKPAWRHLVMCQEIGHTFGLDHQDELFDNPNLGTCMDYTNDPSGGPGGASADDPSNENPNAHDYEQLAIIYNHTDAITTVGSRSAASTMPPAANRGSFNSSAEWGRLVEQSPNGKLELWVHSFGGGARMITLVTRP
jgi:hypothetical protein